MFKTTFIGIFWKH